MPRQELELEKLVIPKGKKESQGIRLHDMAAVLTVYAPKNLTGVVFIQVSPDGEESYATYVHKGVTVKLASQTATDVPVPACKMLRVISSVEEEEERAFNVLELLEM